MSGDVTRARGAVSRAGTRRRVLRGLALVVVVAAAAGPVWAAGAPAPAVAPAVAAVIQGIRYGRDLLGWSNLVVGMTLREAEAASAGAVRADLLEPNEVSGESISLELGGHRVGLTFSGHDPSSRLGCIFLGFPSPQDPAAVKAAVRKIAPDAAFWRGSYGPGSPYVPEEQWDSPIYLVPERFVYVILVHPAEGLHLCALNTVD